MKFGCQCAELDGDNDWFEIDAYDAEAAALKYIERCESMSAGEMLNRPEQDREVVRVKDADGVVRSFEVTMDWSKDFYVHEMGIVN